MEIDWSRRLKDYRSRNGLTQQALADHLGVERTTVVRWEKGEPPSLSFRKRILALTPTMGEGVVNGLVRFVDHLDGIATLLDADLRVVRTSRKHQELLRYETSDLYGRPSEPFWSEQMAAVIQALGGKRGFRRHGVCAMDLALVRRPGERGSRIERPIATVGRTVTVGDPRDPVCFLTTLVITERLDDLPPNQVLGVDGPLPIAV